MRSVTSSKSFIVKYIVPCGSVSFKREVVIYANSKCNAKGLFTLSKRSLYKIISIHEQ